MSVTKLSVLCPHPSNKWNFSYSGRVIWTAYLYLKMYLLRMGLSENGYIKWGAGEKNIGLKFNEIVIGIFVNKIINEFNKKYKRLLNFFIKDRHIFD